MSDNYTYPLDMNWSTDDITSVLSFLNQVEKAYESKVEASQLLQTYKSFKEIVPSKSQEKQIDKAFQKASGYSSYQVVKKAKEIEKGFFSIGR
ncbi:hypothetical protein A9Q68_02335 [Streptococcus bovimastitidis]|uniref:UPF0223 protein A9Q68_02335 n=1 Tax=Streptococcus bovimastitidis TaxID=1856638 RepID=A0A1L8MNS6_9STRE|nr:UPF0223 family protein [Streptococcus bovimastitidis]OJF72399.1 hypothetical protein A9Q68_02335 [Streptococcus bovimastitidis]